MSKFAKYKNTLRKLNKCDKNIDCHLIMTIPSVQGKTLFTCHSCGIVHMCGTDHVIDSDEGHHDFRGQGIDWICNKCGIKLTGELDRILENKDREVPGCNEFIIKKTLST